MTLPTTQKSDPACGTAPARDREDLTEREKLSEQLQTALNNMAHGLAMFDADQRLVVCNRLYYEIYGLTAAQVQQGMTIRQILQARVDAGVYGEVETDSFCNDRIGDLQEFTRAEVLA